MHFQYLTTPSQADDTKRQTHIILKALGRIEHWNIFAGYQQMFHFPMILNKSLTKVLCGKTLRLLLLLSLSLTLSLMLTSNRTFWKYCEKWSIKKASFLKTFSILIKSAFYAHLARSAKVSYYGGLVSVVVRRTSALTICFKHLLL